MKGKSNERKYRQPVLGSNQEPEAESNQESQDQKEGAEVGPDGGEGDAKQHQEADAHEMIEDYDLDIMQRKKQLLEPISILDLLFIDVAEDLPGVID